MEGRWYVYCRHQRGREQRSIPEGRRFPDVEACFALTGGESEASILVKFHDHSDHMFIWEMSQQLAIEAAELDIAVSRCQVDKQDTGFLNFQRVVDVLCEQNYLANNLPPVLKSILLRRELRIAN